MVEKGGVYWTREWMVGWRQERWAQRRMDGVECEGVLGGQVLLPVRMRGHSLVCVTATKD